MTKASRTFGARLREARRAAGMSQSSLERRSGIPKTTLSRYENDRLLPSLQTLRRLTGSLGVTPNSLLGADEHPAGRFLAVLSRRGVRFRDAREAERLAHRVADVIVKRRPTGPTGARGTPRPPTPTAS